MMTGEQPLESSQELLAQYVKMKKDLRKMADGAKAGTPGGDKQFRALKQLQLDSLTKRLRMKEAGRKS